MGSIRWTIVLLSLPLAGCALQSPVRVTSDFDSQPAASCDVVAIARCADRQQTCLQKMRALRNSKRSKPDFLSPREQDLVEQLFAEYLICRGELEQAAKHQGTQDIELKDLSLRYKADHDVQLAALASEDPVLGRALNQSFHRSAIPPGTCDRIIHEVTAAPVALSSESQQRWNDIVQRRAWVVPSVENQVRHLPPVELLADSQSAISTQLLHQKNMFVASIGRLKNPVARPLQFSEQQRRQIRSILRPGDVLLTYTAGMTSNLFIPGNFKHAAIFVGTAEERERTGLDSQRLLSIAGPNNQRLSRVLGTATLASGETPDVVEAIAEGVLLNNFDRILTTRVNRLAVLRPRLNDTERAAQIADALSYVGDSFDFTFDLTDASDQVCTEVVYRSLQSRGGIDIPLWSHAGRLTLAPDDFAKYAMQAAGDLLPCVLMVEEPPEAAGKVRVLAGAEAQQRLAQLLQNGR